MGILKFMEKILAHCLAVKLVTNYLNLDMANEIITN
jgi:hypothetical protein